MVALCGVCKKKDQSFVPVDWCTECQKALCSTCSQVHEQEDHETMSYSDYSQLPPLIKNINQTCPEHNEKYLYLCREHDQLICPTCLKTGHKKCKEIPILKDIIGNVKTSHAFDNVTCEMEETSKILQNGIEKLQINLDEIQNQRKEMEGKVEDTMVKIMRELKKVKNDMLADINAVMQRHEKNVVETMMELQTMEKELREIIDQKQSITLHATNLQTYFGIKEMEKLEEETIKSLKELSGKGVLDTINIGLDQTKSIDLLLNELKLFGEIKVVKRASDVFLETNKPQEAQSMTYALPQYIPKYINLLQKIDVERGDHRGCCTLPNGMVVVITLFNKWLKLVNPDGTMESTVTIAPNLWDVTTIDENCVAVSHERIISIVDVIENKITRCWNTLNTVTGISYRDGNIIFCVPETGVKRLNIDAGIIDNVINDKDVGYQSHIGTGSDRICYTCPEIDTVTVLNQQYDVILKYKDTDRLNCPMGVIVDSYDNVYVIGHYSNNVLVISQDGQRVHQLLNRDDGLCEPTGIHYDSRTKQLIVITRPYTGTFCKYSLGI